MNKRRTPILLIALALLWPATALGQVTWDPNPGKDDPPKVERVRCPVGKLKTVDTDGHCCWPGQVWSADRCLGMPTNCPAGMKADGERNTCIHTTCQEGMILLGAEEHCCWAGQAWSKSRNTCVGRPTRCPENHVIDGESCLYIPPDTDGDNIIDERDLCPLEAEDLDGFKDLDGCPDPDNDEDGVLDKDDQCIDVAEDIDGYDDSDGCPDLDDDGDGIPDTIDRCRDVAEDMDHFEDDDGCPDEDNDQDGVPDVDDLCRDDAEDLNDFDDDDGCPDVAAKRSFLYAVSGWASLGAGLALGGTSLGLHLSAESTRAKVTDPTSKDGFGATNSITQTEALDIEENANQLDTIAAITLGVGSAALIAGGVLLVLSMTEESDRPGEGTAAVSLSPAGLLFQVRW